MFQCPKNIRESLFPFFLAVPHSGSLSHESLDQMDFQCPFPNSWFRVLWYCRFLFWHRSMANQTVCLAFDFWNIPSLGQEKMELGAFSVCSSHPHPCRAVCVYSPQSISFWGCQLRLPKAVLAGMGISIGSLLPRAPEKSDLTCPCADFTQLQSLCMWRAACLTRKWVCLTAVLARGNLLLIEVCVFCEIPEYFPWDSPVFSMRRFPSIFWDSPVFSVRFLSIFCEIPEYFPWAQQHSRSMVKPSLIPVAEESNPVQIQGKHLDCIWEEAVAILLQKNPKKFTDLSEF